LFWWALLLLFVFGWIESKDPTLQTENDIRCVTENDIRCVSNDGTLMLLDRGEMQ